MDVEICQQSVTELAHSVSIQSSSFYVVVFKMKDSPRALVVT